MGSALANLGDIDGDGVVDLAVGASGDDGGGISRGAVYILRLNTDGTVKSGGITKIADSLNGGPTLANFAFFGSSVANLGDLDGDGMIDLAVGAFGENTEGTSRGAVYILRLNTDGSVKSGGITRIASGVNGGPTLGDRAYFGQSVTSLGDFDGDGIGDLAVGARKDSTSVYRAGAVYILRLNANGTVKSNGITQITSGTNGGPTLASRDYFGNAVANVGDIDGDGVTNLVVGATGDDTGGTQRGATYVVRLNADGTVKTNGLTKLAHNLNGGPTLGDFSSLGSSVAGLGDFDADGVADLIVGAEGDFGGGGANRGAVFILRLDVLATPTALDLSANTIAENQPSGTAIGTFSTTDANPFDTFTYTLVTGTGDTDNGSFQIVGNELRSNAVFDFETKSSFSLRLRTTDDGGLWFERTVNVSITNVNEAPTALSLTNTTTSFVENTSTASAIKVADISVTDDALGTNVLSVSGTHAAFFEIVGNELRLKAGTVLDFEATPTLNVTVEVNDATVGGAVDASAPFTVTLTNVLDTTASSDAFTFTFSALNVSVTHAINPGLPVLVGTFPRNAPIVLNGLSADDSVRVVATSAVDVFTVSSAGLVVNGTTLTLNGPALRTLVGGAANDVYQFDADSVLGAWTLDESGGGTDTIDFSSTTTVGLSLNMATVGAQSVHSTNLSLSLGSGATFENATGGSGADTLIGNNRNNTLTGGDGNDLLVGAAGNDLLFGGANNDTYSFGPSLASEVDEVTENLNEGLDTLSFASLATSVTLTLESDLTQSVHTNRTLKLNSAGTFENATGGTGADSLTGNGLDNTLLGGRGNDTLMGAAGSDKLSGGANGDTYVFGLATVSEADEVSESFGDGVDTLSFALLTTDVVLNLARSSIQSVHTNRTLKLSSPVTIENIIGGAGNDTLIGNWLNNTLTGGSGDDKLTGAAGSDVLIGGANNDTYFFGTASTAEADQVTENENEGIDRLHFAFLTTSVVLNLGSTSVQAVHTNQREFR